MYPLKKRFKSNARVLFPNFSLAVEAVRQISQSGLNPTVCRLLDAVESLVTGLNGSGKPTLLLGFESSRSSRVNEMLLETLELFCKPQGGVWPAGVETTSLQNKQDEEQLTWKDNFLNMPYYRDELVQAGFVTETFETCCTWTKFKKLHEGITKVVMETIKAYGAHGIIFCRFTHVYPDGPAPYYTVICTSPANGNLLELWDSIKSVASDTLVTLGGTITHHHAVGRDHQPWYVKEKDEVYFKSLVALKSFYDPQALMNPGVLVSLPRSRL
eukprot:TRINITY_DN5822_c0_g1_i4.p1 TRINITY_DN5822_c0_g1~~TRINITY_DN5822_c0_g1_i4.p1  ORF type:complete len:271 (-),score=63.32 TRINITY_DN5822_c0_g1_i4:90-902(-)